MNTELLPGNALSSTRIAISVSGSPDLDRLGLLELHLKLALAEIARSVLVSGGSLSYGGYLRSGGYTEFLLSELQKYGRRDQPLDVCLAWQEHRELRLSELEATRHTLALYARFVCLDPDGAEVDPSADRGEDALAVEDPELRTRALTAMRQYQVSHTNGRVLIGGRRRDFQGTMPGLVEEAMMSLEAGQPLYLAGGFGGVTADVVQALGIDDQAWLPPRTDSVNDDPRLIEGCDLIRTMAARPGWQGLNNGLSAEENRRLSASHRPSDLAALVSLGLGRLRQEMRGNG